MTYTSTEFHTVEDKIKFENQFKRFVKSGFKRTLFPKWFYKELSFCFGHIAHYDQNGFYATWFANKASQIHFLQNAAGRRPYGDPAYTYSDVERVLGAWVRDSGLIEELAAQVRAENETAERTELARLKAKYEADNV